MTTQTWRNRPIADEKDGPELDRLTAHHIAGGAETNQAEESSYSDYKKRQHLQAAAFHLGSAARLSKSGYRQDAEKHHSFYRMHLSAVGHKHSMKVPDEVLAIVPTTESGNHRFFENHKADRLVTK